MARQATKSEMLYAMGALGVVGFIAAWFYVAIHFIVKFW